MIVYIKETIWRTIDGLVVFLFLLSNSSLFRLFFFTKKHFLQWIKKKKRNKINESILICHLLFLFIYLSNDCFFLVAIDVQKHYSYLTIINNSVIYYIISMHSLALCFFFAILNWSILIEIILTYIYDLIICRRSLSERKRVWERDMSVCICLWS
jgi:hypothetical protein